MIPRAASTRRSGFFTAKNRLYPVARPTASPNAGSPGDNTPPPNRLRYSPPTPLPPLRQPLAHFGHPPPNEIAVNVAELRQHARNIRSFIGGTICRPAQKCIQRQPEDVRELNQTGQRRQGQSALEAADGLLLDAQHFREAFLGQLTGKPLLRNRLPHPLCHFLRLRPRRHIQRALS